MTLEEQFIDEQRQRQRSMNRAAKFRDDELASDAFRVYQAQLEAVEQRLQRIVALQERMRELAEMGFDVQNLSSNSDGTA